jgi:menaquinone-dependent protoporphyrinogen oxidase
MARQADVLVAYASRHGSTRGVAERVAARLAEHGGRVHVRPVDQVDDLDGYDAVVFGGPVYNGAWLPEAERFVCANVDELAGGPVWLFSVGAFGDRKRVFGPLMKKEPKGIAGIRQALHPRDYRVFAGVIDRHQWPVASRLFYRALGGRLGDNRDWPEIDAWAGRIAHELQAHCRSRSSVAR